MAEDVSLVDAPSGIMMPGAILFVLFGSMLLMALAMLRVDAAWKAGALSLAIGILAVPAMLHALPFWVAFYAPWLLGVMMGSALGALVREERLTALLLLVSAALASIAPLWPYKSVTHWAPPWTATDVLLITFIELFDVAIFTWLVAAVLLLVLALLIAGPLNLVSLLNSRSPAPGEGNVTEVVNRWFKDRIQIVFGILGVVSEVGSSRAELETARLRAGMLRSDSKYRR